jgi:hypothetical protein
VSLIGSCVFGLFGAKVHILVTGQSLSLDLRFTEVFNETVDGYGKSRLAEAISVVEPVASNMVVLAEEFLAFFGVGDRKILERGLCQNRNLEDRLAAGFQDAKELAHRFAVFRDVFEDMAAENDVECVIRVTDVGDVHRSHDVFAPEISGQVVDGIGVLEHVRYRRFGSDV